jgi:ribonuclease HI
MLRPYLLSNSYMDKVTLYTDGACQGNPGPGGFAAILVFHDDDDREVEIVGGKAQTTNNQMEITSVIKGLEALDKPCEVRIVSDSKYVINTMTQGWKRKANLDLWPTLDALCAKHRVSWSYVKGHAGHKYNERCDQLAVAEAKKFQHKSSNVIQQVIPANATVIYIIVDCGGENYGRCAWAATVQANNMCREFRDVNSRISSNQSALLAAIEALKALEDGGEAVIFTNNGYLKDGITKWLDGWQKRNWRTADGQPVKNQEYWKELYLLAQSHNLTWNSINYDAPSPQLERTKTIAADARQNLGRG